MVYFFEKCFESSWGDSIYLDDDCSDTIITEAAAASHIIIESIYTKIESVLSTPIGDRKFKQLIGSYMDRNSEKLHTPGPQYLIPFGDTDKAGFYTLFNITEKEIVAKVNEVISKLESNSDFKLLRGNPIFWVFYCCIRYYTLKNDEKGINTSLAIYALSVYPSVFHMFFRYGADEGVMRYTIDNLTDQFTIKKSGHIFGALFISIQSSYRFLKPYMKDASDTEIIRFIQRIRNDQKSMIKKICDKYMTNHALGLRVSSTKDSNSDIPIDDESQNKTTTVDFVTRKVMLQLLVDGVNLKRASLAAKFGGVSVSDTRYYLSRILVDKNNDDIERFISSILFVYLYDENKKQEDINSKEFLYWSRELFRKTNSNNDNIRTIKTLLDKWGEETGVHEKFKREGSRVGYKKAIFFYFIFSIQFYNN